MLVFYSVYCAPSTDTYLGAAGCALQTKPNPAQSCGIISYRDPKWVKEYRSQGCKVRCASNHQIGAISVYRVAADTRRRARRRLFVLQVPDKKADAVTCERLR